MSEDFTFTPAKDYTDRHGLFIALVGGTNSGKTYSGLSLAKGIAEAQGKRIAVLDTEGGRTLHLKKVFGFDVRVLEPPHRPARYLQAAQSAQAKGYGALLIDSFSMEWRGLGGKLDWTDEKLDEFVQKKKFFAERDNERFDEEKARLAGKAAASIEPSMSHKLMELGLLGLRMPVIFAIRGADSFDPKVNKAVFKAQCRQDFLFDVTVSFRLASDKKGIIDLSDAKTWKMEGDHAAIFKNGEQLSEEHGRLVNAWAAGAPLPKALSFKWTGTNGKVFPFTSAATWRDKVLIALKGAADDTLPAALTANLAELEAHMADAPDEAADIFNAFASRGVYPPSKTSAGEEQSGLGV